MSSKRGRSKKKTNTRGRSKSRSRRRNNTLKNVLIIVATVAAVCVAAVAVKAAVTHLVDSPKSVVERLEDSYNDRSLKEAISCFDPDSQELINGAMNLVGSFIGEEDLLSVTESLFQISQYVEDEDLKDFQDSRLELDVIDVQKEGDTAKVTINVKLYCGDELICDEESYLPTVKVDGEWYIDGAQIAGLVGSELF